MGVWQVFPTTSFKLKKKNGEKNVLGCFHIFFINEKNAHVFQQQPKKTLKFRVFSTTKFLTTSSLPKKQLLNFLLQNLLLLHQRCILYLQLIYLWFAIHHHHQITMMKLIQIAQKIVYKCKVKVFLQDSSGHLGCRPSILDCLEFKMPHVCYISKKNKNTTVIMLPY